jgi:aminoglycoside 6'-N-acetyltransferase I
MIYQIKMTVRQYCPTDESEWLRMRKQLWPLLSVETHRSEMTGWLTRSDAVVLVAPRAGGGLSGFAEVGARSLADGCETSPVAYLEGWFVDGEMRRRGAGRALVAAAEAWAQEHGFREFASDAELENLDSQKAHIALGFHEVDRLVLYLKKL